MTRTLQMAGCCIVPALWAINTQFGQMSPYVDCVTQRSWSGLANFAILAVAVAVAIVTTLAARRLAGTDRFRGVAGGLIISIFAFAVLLQALATLVIDPCAR
jgi:uncharacterized membrane protein YkvI